jgi:hypothetical protein
MIKTSASKTPVKMKVNWYIYLIQEQSHSNTGAVKIGMSTGVDKRMETLQVGNSSVLRLIATMGPFGEVKANCFEQQLHRRFKCLHIRGEWFDHRCLKRLQKYDEINTPKSDERAVAMRIKQ